MWPMYGITLPPHPTGYPGFVDTLVMYLYKKNCHLALQCFVESNARESNTQDTKYYPK